MPGGSGRGPSQEVANILWWVTHGLVVLVLVLGVICSDRGVRIQAHAAWYRLRAWLNGGAAGGGGARYTTVSQPGSKSKRQQQKPRGAGLVAVGVPRFAGKTGGAKAGRAASGRALVPVAG